MLETIRDIPLVHGQELDDALAAFKASQVDLLAEYIALRDKIPFEDRWSNPQVAAVARALSLNQLVERIAPLVERARLLGYSIRVVGGSIHEEKFVPFRIEAFRSGMPQLLIRFRSTFRWEEELEKIGPDAFVRSFKLEANDAGFFLTGPCEYEMQVASKAEAEAEIRLRMEAL